MPCVNCLIVCLDFFFKKILVWFFLYFIESIFCCSVLPQRSRNNQFNRKDVFGVSDEELFCAVKELANHNKVQAFYLM